MSLRPMFLMAAALSLAIVSAQPQPQLIRIAYSKVRANGVYDYQTAAQLFNAGAKKSGLPWREVWATNLFGEVGMFVSVTPVARMAQFDDPGPVAGLTEQDRTKYMTLIRNSVEQARYVLVQTLPDLTISSDRKEPPKFARVTNVRVMPGRQAEFEEFVKATMVPAMKRIGVKDYWFMRNVLGGATNEYTVVQLFDKWSELDALLNPAQYLGPDFKTYLSKTAATVASAENMVVSYMPELSYRTEQ